MKKRDIIKQTISIILKHCTPERIYLFGSQVDGEAGERSDIDIAYDAEGFKNDLLIKEELKEMQTLFKIDVVNLARTEQRFRQRVLDTGKVMWSRTKLMRFEDGLYNFSKALERFTGIIEHKESYNRDGYGDVFLDVAVKRFEFTFEMAWKACYRALAYLGFDCKTPRDCLREAFNQKLIDDENVWLEMLEQRNLSSHTYDEPVISELNQDMDRYLEAFVDLKDKLEELYRKQNNI